MVHVCCARGSFELPELASRTVATGTDLSANAAPSCSHVGRARIVRGLRDSDAIVIVSLGVDAESRGAGCRHGDTSKGESDESLDHVRRKLE